MKVIRVDREPYKKRNFFHARPLTMWSECLHKNRKFNSNFQILILSTGYENCNHKSTNTVNLWRSKYCCTNHESKIIINHSWWYSSGRHKTTNQEGPSIYPDWKHMNWSATTLDRCFGTLTWLYALRCSGHKQIQRHACWCEGKALRPKLCFGFSTFRLLALDTGILH